MSLLLCNLSTLFKIKSRKTDVCWIGCSWIWYIRQNSSCICMAVYYRLEFFEIHVWFNLWNRNLITKFRESLWSLWRNTISAFRKVPRSPINIKDFLMCKLCLSTSFKSTSTKQMREVRMYIHKFVQAGSFNFL
jgi:hypothetical protein